MTTGTLAHRQLMYLRASETSAIHGSTRLKWGKCRQIFCGRRFIVHRPCKHARLIYKKRKEIIRLQSWKGGRFPLEGGAISVSSLDPARRRRLLHLSLLLLQLLLQCVPLLAVLGEFLVNAA